MLDFPIKLKKFGTGCLGLFCDYNAAWMFCSLVYFLDGWMVQKIWAQHNGILAPVLLWGLFILIWLFSPTIAVAESVWIICIPESRWRLTGCWLLAAGCWLLAAGCWLMAAGCWLVPVEVAAHHVTQESTVAPYSTVLCARL